MKWNSALLCSTCGDKEYVVLFLNQNKQDLFSHRGTLGIKLYEGAGRWYGGVGIICLNKTKQNLDI